MTDASGARTDTTGDRERKFKKISVRKIETKGFISSCNSLNVFSPQRNSPQRNSSQKNDCSYLNPSLLILESEFGTHAESQSRLSAKKSCFSPTKSQSFPTNSPCRKSGFEFRPPKKSRSAAELKSGQRNCGAAEELELIQKNDERTTNGVCGRGTPEHSSTGSAAAQPMVPRSTVPTTGIPTEWRPTTGTPKHSCSGNAKAPSGKIAAGNATVGKSASPNHAQVQDHLKQRDTARRPSAALKLFIEEEEGCADADDVDEGVGMNRTQEYNRGDQYLSPGRHVKWGFFSKRDFNRPLERNDSGRTIDGSVVHYVSRNSEVDGRSAGSSSARVAGVEEQVGDPVDPIMAKASGKAKARMSKGKSSSSTSCPKVKSAKTLQYSVGKAKTKARPKSTTERTLSPKSPTARKPQIKSPPTQSPERRLSAAKHAFSKVAGNRVQTERPSNLFTTKSIGHFQERSDNTRAERRDSHGETNIRQAGDSKDSSPKKSPSKTSISNAPIQTGSSTRLEPKPKILNRSSIAAGTKLRDMAQCSGASHFQVRDDSSGSKPSRPSNGVSMGPPTETNMDDAVSEPPRVEFVASPSAVAEMALSPGSIHSFRKNPQKRKQPKVLNQKQAFNQQQALNKKGPVPFDMRNRGVHGTQNRFQNHHNQQQNLCLRAQSPIPQSPSKHYFYGGDPTDSDNFDDIQPRKVPREARAHRLEQGLEPASHDFNSPDGGEHPGTKQWRKLREEVIHHKPKAGAEQNRTRPKSSFADLVAQHDTISAKARVGEKFSPQYQKSLYQYEDYYPDGGLAYQQTQFKPPKRDLFELKQQVKHIKHEHRKHQEKMHYVASENGYDARGFTSSSSSSSSANDGMNAGPIANVTSIRPNLEHDHVSDRRAVDILHRISPSLQQRVELRNIRESPGKRRALEKAQTANKPPEPPEWKELRQKFDKFKDTHGAVQGQRHQTELDKKLADDIDRVKKMREKHEELRQRQEAETLRRRQVADMLRQQEEHKMLRQQPESVFSPVKMSGKLFSPRASGAQSSSPQQPQQITMSTLGNRGAGKNSIPNQGWPSQGGFEIGRILSLRNTNRAPDHRSGLKDFGENDNRKKLASGLYLRKQPLRGIVDLRAEDVFEQRFGPNKKSHLEPASSDVNDQNNFAANNFAALKEIEDEITRKADQTKGNGVVFTEAPSSFPTHFNLPFSGQEEVAAMEAFAHKVVPESDEVQSDLEDVKEKAQDKVSNVVSNLRNMFPSAIENEKLLDDKLGSLISKVQSTLEGRKEVQAQKEENRTPSWPNKNPTHRKMVPKLVDLGSSSPNNDSDTEEKQIDDSDDKKENRPPEGQDAPPVDRKSSEDLLADAKAKSQRLQATIPGTQGFSLSEQQELQAKTHEQHGSLPLAPNLGRSESSRQVSTRPSSTSISMPRAESSKEHYGTSTDNLAYLVAEHDDHSNLSHDEKLERRLKQMGHLIEINHDTLTNMSDTNNINDNSSLGASKLEASKEKFDKLFASFFTDKKEEGFYDLLEKKTKNYSNLDDRVRHHYESGNEKMYKTGRYQMAAAAPGCGYEMSPGLRIPPSSNMPLGKNGVLGGHRGLRENRSPMADKEPQGQTVRASVAYTAAPEDTDADVRVSMDTALPECVNVAVPGSTNNIVPQTTALPQSNYPINAAPQSNHPINAAPQSTSPTRNHPFISESTKKGPFTQCRPEPNSVPQMVSIMIPTTYDHFVSKVNMIPTINLPVAGNAGVALDRFPDIVSVNTPPSLPARATVSPVVKMQRQREIEEQRRAMLELQQKNIQRVQSILTSKNIEKRLFESLERDAEEKLRQDPIDRLVMRKMNALSGTPTISSRNAPTMTTSSRNESIHSFPNRQGMVPNRFSNSPKIFSAAPTSSNANAYHEDKKAVRDDVCRDDGNVCRKDNRDTGNVCTADTTHNARDVSNYMLDASHIKVVEEPAEDLRTSSETVAEILSQYFPKASYLPSNKESTARGASPVRGVCPFPNQQNRDPPEENPRSLQANPLKVLYTRAPVGAESKTTPTESKSLDKTQPSVKSTPQTHSRALSESLPHITTQQKIQMLVDDVCSVDQLVNATSTGRHSLDTTARKGWSSNQPSTRKAWTSNRLDRFPASHRPTEMRSARHSQPSSVPPRMQREIVIPAIHQQDHAENVEPQNQGMHDNRSAQPHRPEQREVRYPTHAKVAQRNAAYIPQQNPMRIPQQNSVRDPQRNPTPIPEQNLILQQSLQEMLLETNARAQSFLRSTDVMRKTLEKIEQSDLRIEHSTRWHDTED